MNTKPKWRGWEFNPENETLTLPKAKVVFDAGRWCSHIGTFQDTMRVTEDVESWLKLTRRKTWITGPEAERLHQAVHDLMFDDATRREMGVNGE